MPDNDTLKGAMLRADGIAVSGISPEDREILKALLDRGKTRFRRLKWATSFAWAALLPVCVLAVLWARAQEWHLGIGALITFVVAYVLVLDTAIALTIAFMIKAYYLQRFELKVQATELLARIESIEEEMCRLASRG